MKPRLIILVVLAIGIAGYWAWKVSSAKPESTVPELKPQVPPEEETDPEIRDARIRGEELWKRQVDCERAPGEPDVSVRVEVDTSTGKNRMWLYFTEAHGWYAQYFAVDIWYTGGDESVDKFDSQYSFEVRKNEFIRAKDTLRTCIELNPGELARVGGSIGKTGDWKAEVTYTDPRACVTDPDPLPALPDSTCK
ncbi:MAG: hypothetical protein J5J06_05340 [Phycisphaerae bacterium]|nr:hypothetical protein [Phycisphaerae bacterium]